MWQLNIPKYLNIYCLWQLSIYGKNIPYFNIHEYSVLYLLKFILLYKQPVYNLLNHF